MASFWINLTDNCNLNCSYCYQKVRKYGNMTLETAGQVVSMIKERCKVVGAETLKLTFFGGEPLLNFDALKYIVDSFSDFEFPATFLMTSNFSLASDEIINFLVKHDFGMMISIDGDEDTQELNRSSADKTKKHNTFSSLINAINKLNKLEYGENFRLAKVIASNSAANLKKDIIFLSELHKDIVINFDNNVYTDWEITPEDERVLREELKKAFEWYLNDGRTKGVRVDFFEACLENVANMFMCGSSTNLSSCLGIDSIMPTFSPDGAIHACHLLFEMFENEEGQKTTEELIHLLEHSEDYGKLKNEQLAETFNGRFKADTCIACRYFHYCRYDFIDDWASVCFYRLYGVNTGIGHRKSNFTSSFCINRFMNDYIFEAINNGEVDINALLQQ
ncbi:MAG: 4Fe-4S cluster-binding domain-containing protein [Defluviitaleaceae bacterium]|nr:4Fe-4S cluster-binding domain-containing protein [Defluviitaleaceae bacterium]